MPPPHYPFIPTSPSHASSPFRRDLRRLSDTAFDLLVIGGGSIGTAVARDAALRGLSVALIEREDFGAGTVSRSTRLIHGGLRYLELYDFRLVREALREREVLLRTAPHLVRPLPFLTPIYRGDRWSPVMVGAGMILYDLLSHDKSLPGHRILDVRETLRMEPGLRREGLLGGAVYYDAQVASPERWCLAQAQSAAEAGAQCANHLGAARLLEEGGRIAGVEAEDRLTGNRLRIRARVTVNATGPWAGEVAPKRGDAPRLRLTQGAHLLVTRLTDHAVVLLAQRDGRVFFVVPWRGGTMIGTTDINFTGDPEDAVASSEEVRYLLDETRRVFPRADLSRAEVGFAGVRPLLPDDAERESQVSREHRIVDHAEEGKPGLLSVFGGKLTTARAIAEAITDMAAREVKNAAPCRTAFLPVYGGGLPAPLEEWTQRVAEACRERGLPEAAAGELAEAYGSRAITVLERIGGSDHPLPVLGDAVLSARLERGARDEMAHTTADLLLRRTLRGYETGGARDLAPEVARWLGRLLNRTEMDVRADLEDYERQAERLRVSG